MSWGYSAAGTGKVMAGNIRANGGTYMPEGIKKAVEEIAAKVPDDRILVVESSGHIEMRRSPEKMFDYAMSKELGYQVAVDGTDFDPDPLMGDAVYGGGTLTFKILPHVE